MKRPALLTISALGAGAILAVAAPLAASAHVSVDATSTAAGSYSVLTFSAGHGCDGSPTTRVAIELPETLVAATPTVNPNWTIEKVYAPLDTPIEQEHGDPLEERVSEIVYTAITPLAADQRDTFALSLALAGEEGDVLEFRTTQTCEVGEVVWEGEDVPSVTLTAATEGDGHGHSTDDAAAAPEGHDEPAAGEDVLARVFGIGGLALGAAGLVFGLTARRKASA